MPIIGFGISNEVSATPSAAPPYIAATELVGSFRQGKIRAVDLSDDSTSELADIKDVPSTNLGFDPYRIHYDPTNDRWLVNADRTSGYLYEISRDGTVTFLDSIIGRRLGSCWSEVQQRLLLTKGDAKLEIYDPDAPLQTVEVYADPDNTLDYYSLWEDYITGLLYIGCQTGEIIEIDPFDWSGRREVVDIGETVRGITGEPGGDNLIVFGEAGLIREYAKSDGTLVDTLFSSPQDGVTASLIWDGAIDSDGAIYFSTFGDDQLCRLNTDGTVDVLYTGADTAEGVALDRVASAS